MVYLISSDLSALYQQKTWVCFFFLFYPSHLCHTSRELTFPWCCKSSPDSHKGLPASRGISLSRAWGAGSKAWPHMASAAFRTGWGPKRAWQSLHLPSHKKAAPPAPQTSHSNHLEIGLSPWARPGWCPTRTWCPQKGWQTCTLPGHLRVWARGPAGLTEENHTLLWTGWPYLLTAKTWMPSSAHLRVAKVVFTKPSSKVGQWWWGGAQCWGDGGLEPCAQGGQGHPSQLHRLTKGSLGSLLRRWGWPAGTRPKGRAWWDQQPWRTCIIHLAALSL